LPRDGSIPRTPFWKSKPPSPKPAGKKAIAGDPELASFDGDHHNALVARFREFEEKSREAAVRDVRAKHRAAIPRGAQGGMGVLRAEIGRKRGHMPLRKLMKIAGSTIQKIKPVFLMSPVTVAQFLPPGSVDFDLLVIDEASQVRPEDALGLIARCRRIVVVGDKKQLPPTNFFDRMIADDAAAIAMKRRSGIQTAPFQSPILKAFCRCARRAVSKVRCCAGTTARATHL
jgi:AAA domain